MSPRLRAMGEMDEDEGESMSGAPEALRGGGESSQPEPEQPATSKHNPAWRVLGVGQPPSEEHSKHPTGDYCVYCLSQWPCAEAGGE